MTRDDDNNDLDGLPAGLPDISGITAGLGGGGAGGLGDLLSSAQEAMSAQREATEQTVEGSAGGGMVTVTMTGAGEVTDVTISPQVVDPTDVEMLQDLVVAALRDAGLKVTELQREALGAFSQFDLGGLMGGGAGPDDR